MMGIRLGDSMVPGAFLTLLRPGNKSHRARNASTMSSFDLSEFLAQQKADGQFDSRGSFTLAVKEANQKLARFALPREHAWVVKLLQAAVGWRASSLTLTQKRDTSRFCLRPSRRYGVPQGPEILNAFLSGDLGGGDPLSRFCLAIKSLGEQANFPFLLVIDDGAQTHVSDSNFLGNKALRAEHRYPEGIALTVSHIKAGESKVLSYLSPARLAGRSYAMLQELFDHAPYCAMPLFHDGRPINDWNPSRMHKEHNVSCRPLFTRAIAVERHRQRPWIRPLDLPQAIWAQTEHVTCIPILSSDDEECDAILRLWTAPDSPPLPSSCLYWVAEGAVVERTYLGHHSCVRLEIVADASDLPLDLTGLTLNLSAEATARRRAVLMRASREIEQAVSDCRRMAPFAADGLKSLVRELRILAVRETSARDLQKFR